MDGRDKKSVAWSAYRLLVPRGLKGRMLLAAMSIAGHYLKSKPFCDALREVVRDNAAAVRYIFGEAGIGNGASPARSGGPVQGDACEKAEVDRIALARELASGGDRRAPVCSVVIPVYNHAYHTSRCLRSLILTKVDTPFEIIVVDNASTDHTGDVLEYYCSRVRVITNTHNKGFGAACNQGAEAASGEFVVFLNNDTEVTTGWLDRLTETFMDFGDAGAVGARLVYPDGTLQEAGGIVWQDGGASNYGKGKDPSEPRYGYMREVDYCSAACLMARKDLFTRLGGFDPLYEPAYYEDTDLCFGIRSLGYKVYYQPLGEVIHYEGGTAGTDTNAGLKRYQDVNSEKFRKKWEEALRLQRARSSEALYDASDRRSGPRMLFIDYQAPQYDKDSGGLRLYLMMKLLSKDGCRPCFMLPWDAVPDRYTMALGAAGVRVVPEKEVWGELSSGLFDIVVLSRVVVAEQFIEKIREAAPRVPVVFDTVDVRFVRQMRMAELHNNSQEMAEARKMKEREVKVVMDCDLTIAITDADRDHILKEAPSANVAVIPNVHPPVDVAPTPDGRDALMFIGGYGHQPNVDAVLYFVGEILPLIRRELGMVELLIVGSNPPPEVLALASDGIVVTGFVPVTAPYFRRSRVFVSPLRYGAGMKGKIGEALSHAVPVVTTAVGAEGMGLVHGDTAMIEDDPVAFAADVVRLYKDDALWTRLASQGQRHVRENFGPEAVMKKLASLKALAGPRKDGNGV